MSDIYPIGTKVMSFEWSLLRKSMGTYGVVAGYRPDEKKYMLIPARASKEMRIVGGTECKIADAGFPNNATTNAIYESLDLQSEYVCKIENID
jgi:hypothetical protein